MAGEFVTLDEIRAAGKRLEEVCLRTPVWPSRILSRMAGGTTLLKCENLLRTGPFRIRGAYNRIAKLSPEQRARGVVAASAGNHAQGVALGASLLGVTSTVFMPAGAPLPKVEATGKYGARVVLEGEVPGPLGGQAVGNGREFRQGDHLAGLEGAGERRGTDGLDTDDAEIGAQGLGRRRDARHQAPATDGHDDRAHVRHLFKDLEGDGPLAGDDVPLVEGEHHDRTGLLW